MRTLMWLFLALAVPRSSAAEDCAATGTLGGSLIEHSCFHSTFGPFDEVTATAGSVVQPSTANIDAVHTYYDVAIAPGTANVVTYTPLRSGTWAIFGETDVPHRLLDANGAERPVLLSHVVADCPALPLVRVFELVAGERYTLVLGPIARASTPVVLEKISDFTERHGRDLDGDGYGDDDDAVATPCIAPSGYVPDVGDCNDSDREIHPGAAERCDGIDQDCDGSLDGDACGVGGGGGCAASSRQAHVLPFALLGAIAILARRRRKEVQS